MPSDKRKCPSEPSEPAELKTYRLKRKALRNAFASKSQGYAVISEFNRKEESKCVNILSTLATMTGS